MTDKKQMLHIKATSTSPDGTVRKAEATVPYIKGTMVHLPDEYPFSRNVMLDGDNLFNQIVGSITVDDTTHLTFNLIGEIKLTEKISRKGRCKSI